ncbi:1-phosphofructokinase [Spiroplasma gladiatoris]|uniref:1-phosphofructokinase n=1 Tax=Spiroplasma gladiatoris TaxID=2143 RepID=A0A4V1AQA9_9MOLU|nr:1-phosphofructokinase family hexose kinase [Spiroplasma gladiatoris]QBQ07859.1 1-phosphofructokinase [Spiroplasma gladiatoris]
MKNKVYVISLSPSIDYILKFDNLIKDQTNRPTYVEMYPAGKGIHVSMMLNNLGMKNESIVFSSGEFENYFYKGLNDLKINYKKFQSNGNIRVNLKLIDQNQTECSVKSPSISNLELEKMFSYLKENVNEDDYIIATGSIPENVNEDIYSKICSLANKLKANFVVDSFGESLLLTLDKKPFLIKPNQNELALTLKTKISSELDCINAAKQLIKMGAKNIIVSLGKNGAMFINEETIIKASIGNWSNKLINAAGAGDSMLAGFVNTFIKTNDFEKSLIMSIICGSATAFTNKIASIELIEELSKKKDSIVITKLK